MARIVLACWGSYGDLLPSLGVAYGLRALGHTPVVVTCAYYRELVTREGFEHASMRPDVDPAATDVIRRVMDPRRGSEVVVKELVAPAVRDAYADLETAAVGADVIVSHPITFAAPLLAERTGRPWLSTVLAPLSFFSISDFPVLPNAPRVVDAMTRLGPWAPKLLMGLARRATAPWVEPVRRLRADLGLPPAGDPLYEGQFSPLGTLAMFSRVLASPQSDWPVRTLVTGFPFFSRAIAMPEVLSAFLDAGDPPIVFTLGTSAVGAAGSFYEESLAAATALGRRAVLLVGGHPQNRPRSALPPSVLAVDLAPHGQLFPRGCAIVHQGGVGTTGEALRAGRPTLVVPHAHDQFDNAYRAARTGGARVLFPRHYRARRVIAELRRLLDDPRFSTRAESTAVRVRTEDGIGEAARAIVSVANLRP